MSDERPRWKYRLPISHFEKLLNGVVKITHHWEMTGADTSDDWIELHTKCDFTRVTRGLGSGDPIWDLFQFYPSYKGLLSLTYRGQQARTDLEAIRAYDKKYKAELAEYERLKKKFES